MRLIDAETAKKELARFVGYLDEDTILRLQIALDRLPAVDVWKFVYEELTKLRMFTGIYDARTSDADHFINGVWVVMEVIAKRAGHQDEFNDMFMHNVVESEERAERRE